MIGIKTWLYNLSKTKIYIPKTLTSEVYDSVGGTSLDQIIEKNNNNISDVYSDQKTYAVGDYCIYNNSLYKCITEITTAESFNSAKWKLTSIDEILGNTDISSIGDGTVTGGISALNDSLNKFKNVRSFIGNNSNTHTVTLDELYRLYVVVIAYESNIAIFCGLPKSKESSFDFTPIFNNSYSTLSVRFENGEITTLEPSIYHSTIVYQF